MASRSSGTSASEVSESEDYLSTTSRDDFSSDVDRSESGSESRKKKVTLDLPKDNLVEDRLLEVKKEKERSLSPNVAGGPRRRVGSKERARKVGTARR